MKIVCDACQAKYSISDDKVQGKVFKIRCKKCSNIIVVRGGASAAEAAPAPQQEKETRVYDYGYEGGDHAPAGDEAVWHVVINQDQVGPMTAVDVQQRFSAGEIDSETYVWREGFDNWLPLQEVDTFAQLALAGPASSPARGAAAVASMFGGGDDLGTGRSDPGDLFAAASASARHDDEGDLFGSKPAAPASQGSSKMRGERNENSVLFSLNNLAQLASDKPIAAAPHAASSAAAAPGAAAGAAGGEGSGLIDIRSMASAYLGGPGGGGSKPVSAGIGSIDDLPVFGGGGFSEPAVIVPMTSRSNNNKLIYALIGSVALLAVAAVVVVVVLIKGNGGKPAVAALEPDKPDKVEARVPSGSEPKAPDAVAASKPTDTRSAEPASGSDPKSAGTSTPSANPGSAAGSNPATRVATSEPPPEPKRTVTAPVHKAAPTTNPAPPATPKSAKPADKPVKSDPPPPKETGSSTCDEIWCVLNNNDSPCCAKFKKSGGKQPSGGTAEKPASNLPERLDRGMISEGISKVKGAVTSCGDKFPTKGTVRVAVKVGPDGRITSVTVRETPDPGLGNCVAGMVQKASFGKTQEGGSFAYPYAF